MLSALIRHEEATRAIALARGRTDLHIMPTAAGIELRTRPDYSWDGRKRGKASFVVIQHTLAGKGQLAFEGRHLQLEPGSTMLLRIPHDHRYFVAPGDRWRFFFLVLTGREATYLADEVLRSAGPVLTLASAPADRLAGICLELVDAQTPTPGAASALGYEAMTLLLDHANANTAGSEEDWVAPVLAHIAKQIDRPLPVERLAAIARMSRAHFVRQFTRQVGSAPSEYIFRQRMEKAAHLLEISGHSIADISGQCGFQNPNYFTKAFRRAFAVSPSEFRASGMYTMPPRRPAKAAT